MLTGLAMPSWARLVATAIIGKFAWLAAYFAASNTRPPPTPITLEYFVSDAAMSLADCKLPSESSKKSACGICFSICVRNAKPEPVEMITATRESGATRGSLITSCKRFNAPAEIST